MTLTYLFEKFCLVGKELSKEQSKELSKEQSKVMKNCLITQQYQLHEKVEYYFSVFSQF
jgi:hypothetical protein